MKKYKPIKFSEDFVFDGNKLDYVFKVKKRSYLWLWILLAVGFFLLCCVQCSHDIRVRVVDYATDEPVESAKVTFEYDEFSLCKGLRLFYDQWHEETIETDENGYAKFENIQCSVFSYIFLAFWDADIYVKDDCYYLEDQPATCKFHFCRNLTLGLHPKTESVQVSVIDRDTKEPLSGAMLHYKFALSGDIISDSTKTDASGKAIIKGVPRCGNIRFEKISCYGYEDGTNLDMGVMDAIKNPSKSVFPLNPKKDSFKFRVINKKTKQAIPDATVVVMLTTNNGQTKRSPQLATNVNGEGRGESHKAFVLSMVSFHASKNHYRDTTLVTGLTLEKYRDLPENKRVIELEPLPYEQIFQNVDSITGQPIVGVMNVYTISGNGRTLPKDSVPSNNPDGKFSIWAMEGDHIVIDSRLSPQYKPKHTDIPSFKQGEKIPMEPNYVSLTFRTLNGENGPLLPDCALQISTSQSGVSMPVNSGSGVFTVEKIYPFENISITASKQGYQDNNYTIYDCLVSDLFYAPDEWRDIPLEKEMLPCDGGTIVPKNGNENFHTQTYNLGIQKGEASISIDFYEAMDYLSLYDGPDNTYPCIVNHKEYRNNHQITFRFNNGCVTVVVETGPQGNNSSWKYQVNCPN